MEDHLALFVQDEVYALQKLAFPGGLPDTELKTKVMQNMAIIVKKAKDLSCILTREQVSGNIHAYIHTCIQYNLKPAQTQNLKMLCMNESSWTNANS
jgi:hypothetical protein